MECTNSVDDCTQTHAFTYTVADIKICPT